MEVAPTIKAHKGWYGRKIGENMKLYPHCLISKPETEYRRHARYKDGLRPLCNTCESIYIKKYYKEHKREITEYNRLHVIHTGHDSAHRNWITGLQKRPYPDKAVCEICGRESKKLSYHHWDDKNPSLGIWICYGCHQGCNFVEKIFWVNRYIELKQTLTA